MPKLRVHNFSVSLDGYAAGPDQGLDNPLGVGEMQLHNWAFPRSSSLFAPVWLMRCTWRTRRACWAAANDSGTTSTGRQQI
jgi:hypothetical protein